MIRPRSPSFLLLLGCTLVLVLACSPINNLFSADQPAVTEAADNPPAAAEEVITQVDSWVTATGALRSVEIELITAISNREPKALSARVDSVGNAHLSLPMSHPQEFTASEEGGLPGNFELFIVDGGAYTRLGGEGPAVPDDSYKFMLTDTLLGPQGPGLWLNLIPQDNFIPMGQETLAGFEATKYTVEGRIESGSISGTIWVDDQAGALVGAQLTVSESLFFPPGSAPAGDVSISLTVQHADVPAITLPETPDGG